jgi:two-component system sensor histidine kinase HydH
LRLSIRHLTYFKGNYIYLAVILIFSTIIIASGILLIRKNAFRAVQDSLKLQALGIAVSLEASLKDNYELRKQKNIFKEIITDGRWEGIAFIALYDRAGNIILHSNENLIGRKISDSAVTEAAKTGEPLQRYATLGTDERVFILYFPVHMQDDTMILMLSLHTYPAEGIIRQARLHAIGMLFVLAILWVTGILFIRKSKHSEELKSIMAERERLAVIGEMASVLAHEIRNPLGSIKGFAQYLKEQNVSGSVEYLDIIVSESRRLEILTEDLLMYAKPAELKIESFDAFEFISEVVKAVQNNKAVNMEIYVPAGLTIKSDRDKLKQILINILHNAIDAESKTIGIKAELNNDNMAISVSDDGCGMDKEKIQKAFKPFFTTKTKGTGLGLAIVDKLVKAIGGDIGVESEPQRGAVFTVTIPKCH